MSVPKRRRGRRAVTLSVPVTRTCPDGLGTAAWVTAQSAGATLRSECCNGTVDHADTGYRV